MANFAAIESSSIVKDNFSVYRIISNGSIKLSYKGKERTLPYGGTIQVNWLDGNVISLDFYENQATFGKEILTVFPRIDDPESIAFCKSFTQVFGEKLRKIEKTEDM